MGPAVQVDIVLVQHLLNFWDAQGVHLAPVLSALCISDAGPLPPWIGAEKLRSAQEMVRKFTKDALLSIKAGIYLAGRDLPMAQLLRCAENLAQGIPAALRYVHRSVGLMSLRIEPGDDQVRLLPVAAVDSEMSRYDCQETMAIIASLCRESLGDSLRAGDLCLRLACAPGYESEIEQMLGVDVRSDDACRLDISASAWQRLNPRYQPLLFGTTLRELERREKKLQDHLLLYSELQSIIEACLLRRHVSQEDVAGQLGISVRNLQRRMKALGTSYQILLDECRQTLAMKLIRDESVPLYEIAYMVGYAEPSAFYKAFRRWTGTTPGDYRLAQDQVCSDV
ncbi:helix-turn-helix transcriptional regulator [Thalassolituus sp. LLYu03]|uniref:helix-turn-helix transcriptional regulator n=1 Tax=Thalassolituus sp. LLYu03 TaxID=3421656 RepID=UPI003D2E9085